MKDEEVKKRNQLIRDITERKINLPIPKHIMDEAKHLALIIGDFKMKNSRYPSVEEIVTIFHKELPIIESLLQVIDDYKLLEK